MASDPNSPITTTFVQADPSTFRAVVQRLTGATPTTTTTTPRPPFKLHERRHHSSTNKLEITLNNNNNGCSRDHFKPFFRTTNNMSPVSRERGFVVGMSSPVSTLDHVYGGRSPRTPVEEEEDKAIAEKGFYLHPSPLSTPRGNEPELLVLFPLSSPKTDSSSTMSF